MIVLVHRNGKIIEVKDNGTPILGFEGALVSKSMLELARRFPNRKIIWCNSDCHDSLNVEEIESLLHHDKMMLSYHPDLQNYFGSRIGYVEDSPFIKINKKVTYPTWQMSSLVGVTTAKVLNEIGNKIPRDADFDYYLNSLAKIAMPLGLLCYSEPQLLKLPLRLKQAEPSIFKLFRFVRQHYKIRWVLLLFLNLLIYEHRFTAFSLLGSLFFKSRRNENNNLDAIQVHSNRKVTDQKTIDVIIPTIGRKCYLYDVLNDLKNQTHLPKNVIIVEQNPLEDSTSELDFLSLEKWPFAIKHIFTHQTGACNARNLALQQVESEWVFLNDDDNRFESDLLEKMFFKSIQYGTLCTTASYLQQNENFTYKTIHQSGIFGSGNSFLKSDILNSVSFNKAFEFGYGEDNDFGMQLRNQGIDVIYFPDLKITHLKAPIGGFRTKFIHQWENESIQPKPSPTVMLYNILHKTSEQLRGYKLVLFFKLFKLRFDKISQFRTQWKRSVFWSKKILQ